MKYYLHFIDEEIKDSELQSYVSNILLFLFPKL